MSTLKFSSNDVLFTKGIVNVDYLVIGGGGGGRSIATNPRTPGAGGGAGDYVTSVSGESSGGGKANPKPLFLTRKRQYRITVGSGGAVNATGNQSLINRESGTANPLETVGAIGGGAGGGGNSNDDRNGGAMTSADGVAPRTGGTAGLMGFAYPGGDSFGSTTNTIRAAGGGGGASAAGSDGVSGVGGNGGNGLASSITGSSVTRAGGGGGACSGTTTQGTGGTGGGGNAASDGAAGNGTVNTGSGGGGLNYITTGTAGTGGSGLVVIKYPKRWVLTVGAGLTSSTSTSGNYKITEFTAGSDIITFS